MDKSTVQEQIQTALNSIKNKSNVFNWWISYLYDANGNKISFRWEQQSLLRLLTEKNSID